MRRGKVIVFTEAGIGKNREKDVTVVVVVNVVVVGNDIVVVVRSYPQEFIDCDYSYFR